MKMQKFVLSACMVGAMMMCAGSSWGADFPNKPIRIFMGVPGSGTDLMVRAMAPTVEKALGQPLVVEGKVGGGGMLALEMMNQAKPDGYTVAATPDAPITGAPHMLNVSYNPQRDFASLILLGTQGGVIAVRSDSSFKNLQDFVEYARKNPGQLTMGVAGTGNNAHLGVVQLTNHDKIKLQYVPFPGAVPTTTALLGGHVMSASYAAITALPHVKAGTLRVLVVLNKTRMAEMPDVPTADELGYPSAVTDIVGIKGILTVSKAVPKPAKDRLIAAFLEGMKSPDYRKFALQNGLTLPAPPIVGEELDKYLHRVSELARETIHQLGIQKK